MIWKQANGKASLGEVSWWTRSISAYTSEFFCTICKTTRVSYMGEANGNTGTSFGFCV